MFSSIFGSKQLSPEEQRVVNSAPYKALATDDEKKGYLQATQKEILIYKKSNVFPLIEDIRIKLDGSQQDQYIHTIKYPKINNSQNPQNQNAPSILLLHGYGGTSLSYYKMISLFQNQFDTYAIDFLGMGLSSHQDYNLTTINENINYFVESLEKWRLAKGIRSLIIVGHSFGGYMGFNYAMKYPEIVTQLFLISPLGGTKRTQEEVEQWFKKRQEDAGFASSLLFKYFSGAWKEKKTIAGFLRQPLIPTYFLLNNYIKKRLNIGEEIRSDWYDYLTGVHSLPESSDKAVFYLLRFPRLSAIHSIEEILKHEIHDNQKQFRFHIHFLYGDSDWMCAEGAKRIIETQITPSSFFTVEKSSHNIVYDQPKTIHDYIIRHIN